MTPIPQEPFNNHQHPTPLAQANKPKLLQGIPIPLEPFQQSSVPYSSSPRKETHTQTPTGHDTYTPISTIISTLPLPPKETAQTQTPAEQEIYTPGALQLSSAPHLPYPRKRTHTQTLAGHETNTNGASQPSSAPYLSRPKVRTVANPPQELDIVPMRKPQQTSYEITEIKLRDVSNKLGAEWKMVGTYLGYSSSQIEVMQEENRFLKVHQLFHEVLG